MLTTISELELDITEPLWIPEGSQIGFGCATLIDCSNSPRVVSIL
jgi:hypothetical protein